VTTMAVSVMAVVFGDESAALDALLAIQERLPARIEIGLRPVGNGVPNDRRAILAVRIDDDVAHDVRAIMAEFHGSVISR